MTGGGAGGRKRCMSTFCNTAAVSVRSAQLAVAILSIFYNFAPFVKFVQFSSTLVPLVILPFDMVSLPKPIQSTDDTVSKDLYVAKQHTKAFYRYHCDLCQYHCSATQVVQRVSEHQGGSDMTSSKF